MIKLNNMIKCVIKIIGIHCNKVDYSKNIKVNTLFKYRMYYSMIFLSLQIICKYTLYLQYYMSWTKIKDCVRLCHKPFQGKQIWTQLLVY